MTVQFNHEPDFIFLYATPSLEVAFLSIELGLLFLDYANCNGEYTESEVKVSWAPERPVFKHRDRDR